MNVYPFASDNVRAIHFTPMAISICLEVFREAVAHRSILTHPVRRTGRTDDHDDARRDTMRRPDLAGRLQIGRASADIVLFRSRR